jgi:AcrR family transcriptional regulator
LRQGPEEKRQEILNTARSLFVTEGYAATGMEVVARHAGVSTATLYAHFQSKADLFRATLDELISEVAEGIARGAEDGGSAQHRLTAFAKSYAAFCANPNTRAVLRMVCAERRRFADTGATVETRVREEIGGVAIALITKLADEGALAVEKPAWAASQLLGMIEHATLIYGLMRGDEAQPERPAASICEDAVVTFMARYGA